ncbi:MAG: RND family transporter [Bilifractor sp.]
MVKVGKWIARHRILILILAVIMLIPSAYGYFHTKTNYDLLTYLPKSLDTMKGQDIIVDEYGMGSFSMIVVDNESMKDVAKLEKDIEAVPHVKDVLWYDDVADLSLPVDMIPQDLREKFFKGDATMMLAMFDDTSSADTTMEAVDQIRSIVKKDTYVSGITAIMNDLRDLTNQELPIYVTIAVVLCLIAMLLLTDSFLVPFLFLLDIGIAIMYNMGTNQIFGSISYVTKAVAAVLQLGVTTDYSIFLLGSYRENKLRFPGEKERAMGHAISNTFKSIVGSSITTIAGFIALCFMSFTLGLDMGLVMAKGVVFGVLTCVTVLPSLVLLFDKPITKTTHKPLLGHLEKASDFITKHYKIWMVIFLAMFIPAVYGNNHVKNYYDMSGSLPKSLPSMVAQQKVEDDFGSSTMHIIVLDKDTPVKNKVNIINQVNDVDGVNYVLGLNSLVGSSVPDSMIPSDVRDMLQSKDYELMFVSTQYYTGSDEVNKQIDQINTILKKYDKGAMLIGEAPLTHDLVDVTNVDFMHVNTASLLIIFFIILMVFKSFSLPFILEITIEFAIFVNMAIMYYTGTSVSFVTSIVLGTVQLGSTVDYAILMTSRYQKERQRGHEKKEAVQIAHRACMGSIITSGVAFFAATFGVAVYSNIDIIKSICMMLARGALISMVTVLFILPGMFMIFDKLIVKTSIDFFGTKKAARREAFAQRMQNRKPQMQAAVQTAAPAGGSVQADVQQEDMPSGTENGQSETMQSDVDQAGSIDTEKTGARKTDTEQADLQTSDENGREADNHE